MATRGIHRRAHDRLKNREKDEYDDFEVIKVIINCSRFDNVKTAKALHGAIRNRLPNMTEKQFERCLLAVKDSMRKD